MCVLTQCVCGCLIPSHNVTSKLKLSNLTCTTSSELGGIFLSNAPRTSLTAATMDDTQWFERIVGKPWKGDTVTPLSAADVWHPVSTPVFDASTTFHHFPVGSCSFRHERKWCKWGHLCTTYFGGIRWHYHDLQDGIGSCKVILGWPEPPRLALYWFDQDR